ncbi:hypothetical protein EVAR_79220_1 [Eumeta japonica]|uniref:Uncharacterized protein n=1 Tax=Eumeta variegata TaxID=151549 RepID=A0A4C1UT81_EUMVA|nr:hypothetical protein EVAR_79220_1 [Eumeta japonica]
MSKQTHRDPCDGAASHATIVDGVATLIGTPRAPPRSRTGTAAFGDVTAALAATTLSESCARLENAFGDEAHARRQFTTGLQNLRAVVLMSVTDFVMVAHPPL